MAVKKKTKTTKKTPKKAITRKRGGRIVSRKTKVPRKATKKTTRTRGAGIVKKAKKGAGRGPK